MTSWSRLREGRP
jgi:hypothetical protein